MVPLRSRGSNGRRLLNEAKLVDALSRWMREHRPSWTLHAIHPEEEAFAREAALVAQSDAVVSLFGSSLHSCRFLARGSVVVEIHGALKSDSSQVR